MADDLSRLIGRLEAGFEAVIDRVNRSDEQTAQKFHELAGLQERREQAAIRALAAKEDRDDARHLENQREIKATREAVTAVHEIATENQRWIRDKGDPMHQAWMLKQAAAAKVRAERRGSLKTWSGIVAIGSTLAGAIGFLGRDAIAAALKKIGEVLS